MRTALPAIAIGASLACACQLASSQVISVTQQGYGNTSSAEQTDLTPQLGQPMSISATIIQVATTTTSAAPAAPAQAYSSAPISLRPPLWLSSTVPETTRGSRRTTRPVGTHRSTR